MFGASSLALTTRGSTEPYLMTLWLNLAAVLMTVARAAPSSPGIAAVAKQSVDLDQGAGREAHLCF